MIELHARSFSLPVVSSLPAASLGDRSLFPALEAFAYCNHAAVSPPSLCVERAAMRFILDYARLGSGAFPIWYAEREGLRGRIARLIGAQPSEVAFTGNTTRGISDIALSMPWKRGDRVLLFEGEFPTNVTPWQCAASSFGLELLWLRAREFDGGPGLDQLETTLRRGVRLVAVSAVQFQSGLRMPLVEMGRLCRRYGAELFVDAIQALGVVPVDVERAGIDYLSSGGHKWLMGPEGTGVVYVRNERAKALVPRVAGWLSHEHADEFLRLGAGHLRYDRPLRGDARVLEGGGLGGLGFAALDAALSLLLGLGIERIFAHVQAYHDALEPHLARRGFRSLRSRDVDRRSGSLCCEAPPGVDAVALHRGLLGAGVTCALPDGLLRFSPHWPNHTREVEGVVSRLDEVLERVAPRA